MSTDQNDDLIEEITSDEECLTDEDFEKAEEVVRERPKTYVCRVSKKTPPKSLATTIIGCLKEWGRCELLCVGPRPRWQADKAIILASQKLAALDIKLSETVGFMEPRPVINGKEMTGVRVTIHATANVA